MEIIPVFSESSSNYEQTLTLEQKTVTIGLTWNAYSERWVMSVVTNGKRIDGIPLVIDMLLMKQVTHLIDLAGDFIVQKNCQKCEVTKIDYDNLGTDYVLLYYTAEEAEIWKGAKYGAY